jgi:DNA-binding NtrC family response regulator
MRILLVDDDCEYITSLRSICDLLGVEVVGARTGAEALRRAEQEEFPVVLIDLCLPDMNGLEVLGRLQPLCPDTRFALATGRADVKAAKASLDPAVTVLSKPLSFDQILSLISADRPAKGPDSGGLPRASRFEATR